MFERMSEAEQEEQKSPFEPCTQKTCADRRKRHQRLDIKDALPQRDKCSTHGKEPARDQCQKEHRRRHYFSHTEKERKSQPAASNTPAAITSGISSFGGSPPLPAWCEQACPCSGSSSSNPSFLTLVSISPRIVI